MFAKPAPIVSHLAFRVADLEQSTRFYHQVLGLQPLEEPFKIGRHSWFALGPHCQLHLIAGASQVPVMHIDHHLALSTPDLDGFITTLQAAGIPFFDANRQEGAIHTRPDGIQQVFFKDPDGYWLEMNNDYTATQNPGL